MTEHWLACNAIANWATPKTKPPLLIFQACNFYIQHLLAWLKVPRFLSLSGFCLAIDLATDVARSVDRVVRLRTTSNEQPFYAMRAMSCACGADARCAFSVRLPSNLRPLHPALRLSMRSPVVPPFLRLVRRVRCGSPHPLRPRGRDGSTPNYAAYRRQSLAE